MGYAGLITVPVSCVNVTQINATITKLDGSVVSGVNITIVGLNSIKIEGLSAGEYIINVTGIGDALFDNISMYSFRNNHASVSRSII